MFRQRLLLSLLAVALLLPAYGKEFSFSETEAREEAEEKQAEEEGRALIEALLATPCSGRLKGAKTAVMVAERTTDGGYETDQSSYGLHFSEINHRLRALGLRTCTPQEIMAQIQKAELEAFFNNDPDAQISAASRLGASFVLRGLIDSRTTFNPIAKVNEVHVTMSFTLVTSGGKNVASVTEDVESYSGSDTAGMALSLVREKADLVVAKLYSQYCSSAK